jgi:hypothetical protein
MIRRSFWLTVGFGLGVAAARQVRRHATTAADAPARLADRLRRDVTCAFHEGRDEMRARETRLRRVLAASANPGEVEDPGR